MTRRRPLRIGTRTGWEDHIALVAALRAGKVEEAVEVSRKHVDILHRTMFMGLAQG